MAGCLGLSIWYPSEKSRPALGVEWVALPYVVQTYLDLTSAVTAVEIWGEPPGVTLNKKSLIV